jgi:creatinine amidohydrolase
VIWSDTASPDIAAAVARTDRGHAGRGQEVGLVPVGAIEQHGPHLPVGTDTIVASALCADAAAMTDSLVLPAISLGVSYGHGTVLAGTLSLTPDLLVATVHQYVRWASVSGLRRLIFVNAHLGNSASLNVATDSVRLLAPRLRVGTLDWWAADPAVLAEVTADGADIHANRAETAMMLAIAPHLVHAERAADADDPDRTAGLIFRYTAPALSRNGVTGRASEASAELGAELRRLVTTAIADRIERGRVEEPPLGIAPAPDFPF